MPVRIAFIDVSMTPRIVEKANRTTAVISLPQRCHAARIRLSAPRIAVAKPLRSQLTNGWSAFRTPTMTRWTVLAHT